MVKGERTRGILLFIALLLLLVAAVLQWKLSQDDALGEITTRLGEFGYLVRSDEIFIEGDYPDTSIAALLPPGTAAEAVEASRRAGFPSRIDRRGDVVLLLARAGAEEVITLYMLDGEMELCFIQKPNEDRAYALNEGEGP